MKNGNDIKTVLDQIREVEGWLSDHEAALLYHAAENVPVNGQIVEIGSWKGKSTICLAGGLVKSGKPGAVWAVDPHKGKLKASDRKNTSTLYAFKRNIGRAGVTKAVVPVVDTSLGAARKWKGSIRILFIDGIHDYKHTSEDIEVWNKYLQPGSLVAFHDCFCGEKGVWRAVNRYFLKPGQLTDVGTVGSILFGIVGKPAGLAAIWVKIKINIIRLAVRINNLRISGSIKTVLIHKIIRLVLINKYSAAVVI